MSLAELPTMSRESDWPICHSIFLFVFLGLGSVRESLSSVASGKAFFRVFSKSSEEKRRVVNSTSRILEVLIFLPLSTHFFFRSARLVLSVPLLSLASSSSKNPGSLSLLLSQPFWEIGRAHV